MTETSRNTSSFCPLCEQPNKCALVEGKTIADCWCKEALLSDIAMKEISASQNLARCICRECAIKTGEARFAG